VINTVYRRFFIILVVLAGSLILGCERDEPGEEIPVVRPVKMLEISNQSIGRRLEFPGRVSPTVQSEHSFEVPGRIASFPVREGQWMQEGELIARLDDHNYQAQLTSSQAKLDSAKADYDRFTALLEKGAVAQRELETRRRNYEVAKANLRIAEKELEDTELRAHFAGRVARKLADDFQNVLAKESVVLLQDDTELEIKVDVPERSLATDMEEVDLRNLTQKLIPTVSITSIPGRSFPAEFKELATAANPTTRTFEVTFSFKPEENIRILPGMTARISIDQVAAEEDSDRGFVIPSNATAIDDQGNNFVWRVDQASMRVEPVLVKLGAMSGTQITISGDLSYGDVIAISGVHHLRKGMQVLRMTEDE
jgi:RND family efflux transporter MFP subunit